MQILRDTGSVESWTLLPLWFLCTLTQFRSIQSFFFSYILLHSSFVKSKVFAGTSIISGNCTHDITSHFHTCIAPLLSIPPWITRCPSEGNTSVPKQHCAVQPLLPTAGQERPSLCSASIHTGTHCSGKPSCFSWPSTTSPLFLMRLWRTPMSRVTLLSERSKVQPCRATLSFSMMTPCFFRPSRHRERNARRSLSVRYPADDQVDGQTKGMVGGKEGE